MLGNIDDAKEKVEQASSFFETLNGFIKKHPIWTFIIVGILIEGGHLSWLLGHTDEVEEPIEEVFYNEVDSATTDTTYITE